MLFKKKVQTENDGKEKYLESLVDKIIQKEEDLEDQVIKVIICKGVIVLYPDGPDKRAAIKDYEHSQQYLLNRIALYDNARQIYISVLEKYQAEGIGLNRVKPLTSHEIVEETYRRFFKTR